MKKENKIKLEQYIFLEEQIKSIKESLEELEKMQSSLKILDYNCEQILKVMYKYGTPLYSGSVSHHIINGGNGVYLSKDSVYNRTPKLLSKMKKLGILKCKNQQYSFSSEIKKLLPLIIKEYK
jgi:hypothetical protein